MIKNSFLGAGPMSLEIITSLNHFSKKYKKKIMLICSRNQIETSYLGGGYVNSFSTKDFSDFVRKKNNPKLIMSRDHSGPYKNDSFKEKLNIEIDNCKKSLSDDIESGFKIIHIDTSSCKKAKYEIAKELINYCEEIALKKNKKIFFEFGCEDHGILKNLDDFKRDIRFFSKFKNRQFIVCQTGSHVKSLFQVGQFDFSGVKKMKKIANEHGILLKEHNCDYLNKEQIKTRKKFGIDAINVAPELGFLQTYFTYTKAQEYNLHKDCAAFMKVVLRGGKWKKWNYNNENNFIKFLTSGHYYFMSDQFQNLKQKINKNIHYQKNLDNTVEENLLKYF
tara:strand:- start:166 stop:1170 length:1005 start_codon:yes stop_codon:yes gene_type:complete